MARKNKPVRERESFNVSQASVLLRMTTQQIEALIKRRLLAARLFEHGYRISRNAILDFCIAYGFSLGPFDRKVTR